MPWVLIPQLNLETGWLYLALASVLSSMCSTPSTAHHQHRLQRSMKWWHAAVPILVTVQHTVHWCTVHPTAVYSVHCTVHCTQCTVHPTAVYSPLHTMYSPLHTMYSPLHSIESLNNTSLHLPSLHHHFTITLPSLPLFVCLFTCSGRACPTIHWIHPTYPKLVEPGHKA